MRRSMPNSTAYQYAYPYKATHRAPHKPPLTGRRGMQCSMPNNTAY